MACSPHDYKIDMALTAQSLEWKVLDQALRVAWRAVRRDELPLAWEAVLLIADRTAEAIPCDERAIDMRRVKRMYID